jgi:hypothetical protein
MSLLLLPLQVQLRNNLNKAGKAARSLRKGIKQASGPPNGRSRSQKGGRVGKYTCTEERAGRYADRRVGGRYADRRVGGQVRRQKVGREGTRTEGRAGGCADRKVGGQVRGQKGGRAVLRLKGGLTGCLDRRLGGQVCG